MGGCRCSYKSCRSATKTTENLHFFHYPVKHRDRCATWINNADKPEFANLPDYQLRNKVVCGLHFEDKFFANVEKRRLVHNAIPTLDAGCDSSSDDLSYIKEVEVMPSSSDGTTFTLLAEHLSPGPSSAKKQKIGFENGKAILQSTNDSAQPEVYTIDPSYFTQELHSKNLKEVVINSTNYIKYGEGDGDDGDSEDHHDPEENCMMIYDTQECVNSVMSIEKQDEGALYFEEEDEDEDYEDKTVETVHIKRLSKHQIARDIDSANSNDVSNHAVSSNSSSCSPTPTSTTVMKPVQVQAVTRPKPAPAPAGVKRTYGQSVEKKPAPVVAPPATNSNTIRLTTTALVRCLKGRIPDSLLGVVSLHLNKRRKVSTTEEQMYLNVMQSIPNAGKLVLTNNGWIMPMAVDKTQ